LDLSGGIKFHLKPIVLTMIQKEKNNNKTFLLSLEFPSITLPHQLLPLFCLAYAKEQICTKFVH